ncbi:serine hydrolase [Reyranella sp.]|uniref:serine hydrolase n=1 Tax=Reyranella sp. TaxID=1929291 RepID=UPI003D11EA06
MPNLYRRNLPALAASMLAAAPIVSRAQGQAGNARVQAAVERFAALPSASCLVVADQPGKPWQVSHQPAAQLFVGSAIKTFILAQYLRDVEAGRLAENTQMAIDDSVRSLSSPVFLKLTGTTPAVAVLEAMIAHSDNTATDVAMGAVGTDRVRALIAQAGLKQTQVPNSTRRLFSYLAGAPEGVDAGWAGILRLAEAASTNSRPALNDRQTMASSAEDMVSWYRQALTGAFFQKPGTLVEFKRIQAMADALVLIVPPDTPAYGKGGSIDWQDFHCFCVAGQMIVGKVPVTFCFTINWTGPADGIGAMFQSYKTNVADVLREAAQAVG